MWYALRCMGERHNGCFIQLKGSNGKFFPELVVLEPQVRGAVFKSLLHYEAAYLAF